MSEIRVTDIKGEDGSAAVNFSKGINASGVCTATTFSGSAASLTSIPAGNLTGTVADARISTLTASKLSGALPAISGANLTGISAGAVLQIKEYVCRDFETQSFNSNTQLGLQLEGHITPSSASNKVRISLFAFLSPASQYNSSIRIMRSTNGGSTYVAVDATIESSESVNRGPGHIPSLWGAGRNWSENQMSVCSIVDSPNTTGQVYYRPFWISNDAGTLYTNYNNNTSSTGNAYVKGVSVLRLEEIDASTFTLTNVT